MKRILLVSIVAALAAAGPAVASPFKGVVVGKTRAGVLVAGSNGVVRSVNAHARIGARVAVSGSSLHVFGTARRAAIRGVVVRHTSRMTVLSAARGLIVVRSGRHLADATPPATPTTTSTTTQTQPGDVVKTDVTIGAQGELDEQDSEDLGQTGQVQVQAVVASVGAGTVTLTVNGQTLTLPLPAGLTLPDSAVGTQVTLTLSFAGGQTTASEDQGDDDNSASASATATVGTGGQSGNDNGDGGEGGGNG